jgi:Asp-tRNA(Asn)/Glu-tRNA(Gln) amidotransferase A subunit family amidase
MPAYTTSPLFNISGHPAISLPLYWHEEKIPLGAQFSAKKNGDALLFSLAAQLERAAPWRRRRPPIHVAAR